MIARFRRLLFSSYGFGMYLRWWLSGYDHVEELILRMDPGWRRMGILDVGSGPGVIAAEPRMKGVNIICVDASQTAVSECKRQGLKAVLLDVREIPKRFYEGDFDIVWCLDILEHLKKEESFKLLSALEKIAKRQVIVFIPLGYFPQDREPEKVANSKFVKHQSFWEKSDFTKRGYRCRVLRGYHWDIRIYCSSLADCPYPVVCNALWAVKEQ